MTEARQRRDENSIYTAPEDYKRLNPACRAAAAPLGAVLNNTPSLN